MAAGWMRAVLVGAVLAAGAAGADVQRPLDERATARLIVAEVQRQAPGAEAILSGDSRFPWVSVQGQGFSMGLLAADVHPQLRAAPDGAAREAVLRDFVAGKLTGVEAAKATAPPPGLDLALVVPMIRSAERVGQRSTLTSMTRVPFLGDLFQCWVMDGPQVKTNCLYTWDVRDAGLGKLEIAALGRRNLQARLGEVVETRDGRVTHLTLGGRLAASLLVLDDYWAERAGAGVLTAAVPTEGDLYWIVDATGAELDALRQRAAARHDEGERGEVRADGTSGGTIAVEPLSRDLLRWTGAGWVVLDG